VTLLRDQRGKLDSLALALLENETLDQLEAHAAAGIAPPARADRAAGGMPVPA
jgi:hypothetical protein